MHQRGLRKEAVSSRAPFFRRAGSLGYSRHVAGDGRPTDPLRTALAAQGVELSSLFFVVFENTILPGTPPRSPRLLAPPGQSTAGGRLARQHITLLPEDGSDAPAVVVGWADAAHRWVQLRSFRAVDAAHQQRFGQRLGLRSGPYGEFVRAATAFFREQGFSVDVQDQAPELAPRKSEPSKSPLLVFAVVLGSALLLGLAIGAMLVILRMG